MIGKPKDEDETQWMIGLVVGTGGVIVLVVFLMIWFESLQCEARWQASGMVSHWQITSGCLVQQPDQTWIPAGNYRVID